MDSRTAGPMRVLLLLFAVLALAAYLRMRGIGFGLPALNDPDELIFELGAMKMLRGGTLNPGWFGHPATTTMYALAVLNVIIYLFSVLVGWVADVKQFADGIYANPGWVILPGRVLMVAFGMLCVWLTYRLGALLFGRASGLAAALLLAVNPVHISFSQIIRSDMMACAFMLLCLHAAVLIVHDGRRRDYLSASIWLALAVATKWPFAITGIAVAGAAFLRVLEHPGERSPTLRNLLLFAACSPVALFLISPFLLLDYRTVIDNLGGEIQLRHLGSTAGTPLQNALWYLQTPLRSAFGVPGLALVAGGLVLFTVRNRPVRFIFMPLILAFLVLITIQSMIWVRWILPLMAPLSIIAGAALVSLMRQINTYFGRRSGIAISLVLACAVTFPLVMDAHAAARERSNDTRQMASQWAIRSIPAGSTVLLEHFAFDLEQRPWEFLFPLGLKGCVNARLFITGKVDYATIDSMRGGRSNLDFGTVPLEKVATCGADYAILTQYDRYYAERDSFGPEYENYRRLAANAQLIATFRPVTGERGGPVIRILRFNHSQTGEEMK